MTQVAGEMDGETGSWCRLCPAEERWVGTPSKRSTSFPGNRIFSVVAHPQWRAVDQRAHLACLLVMEPDLLMLDEPTNHLDLHSSVVPAHQSIPRCPFLTIELSTGWLTPPLSLGGKLTCHRGTTEHLKLKEEVLEQQRAVIQNQQRN